MRIGRVRHTEIIGQGQDVAITLFGVRHSSDIYLDAVELIGRMRILRKAGCGKYAGREQRNYASRSGGYRKSHLRFSRECVCYGRLIRPHTKGDEKNVIRICHIVAGTQPYVAKPSRTRQSAPDLSGKSREEKRREEFKTGPTDLSDLVSEIGHLYPGYVHLTPTSPLRR